MIKKRRHLLTAGLAAVACTCLAPAVSAADYPERPIELIVPFQAGGGTDAPEMQTMLKKMNLGYVYADDAGFKAIMARDNQVFKDLVSKLKITQ